MIEIILGQLEIPLVLTKTDKQINLEMPECFLNSN